MASDLTKLGILMTGGAGFIGSTIVDRLLAGGVRRIVVLDNMIRGRRDNLAVALSDPRVELVEGDLRDAALLGRLMAGQDVLVHLAALRINHCIEDPDQAREVMFDGPFRVFQAAVAAGVPRVVYASSSSVYGLADDFPTGERHHPYNDTTLYGAGKLAGEGVLRAFNDMYGLPSASLRPFNVYGPRMDIHGRYTEVLVRWMERLEADEPPLIFGDGSQTMDFTYIDDVARAFVAAITATQPGAEAYNVGTGVETSLAQLAHALARAMGKSLEPEYRAGDRPGAVSRRLADTRKTASELGMRDWVTLEEGLSRLVSWWRATRTA